VSGRALLRETEHHALAFLVTRGLGRTLMVMESKLATVPPMPQSITSRSPPCRRGIGALGRPCRQVRCAAHPTGDACIRQTAVQSNVSGTACLPETQIPATPGGGHGLGPPPVTHNPSARAARSRAKESPPATSGSPGTKPGDGRGISVSNHPGRKQLHPVLPAAPSVRKQQTLPGERVGRRK
jgi:hypothetical protein